MLVQALNNVLAGLKAWYGGDYNWTDRDLACLFDRFSLVYREEGKLPAAARAIRKAIRIYRSGANEVCPTYARMWRSHGIIESMQGNGPAARNSLQTSIQLFAQCRPQGHEDLVIAHQALQRLEDQTWSPAACR